LLDRLDAGLHWIYQNRQMAYHAALRDVYDQRIGAMEKLVGDSHFDPRDLVATQLLRTENAAAVVGDQSDIAELEVRLKALAPCWTRIALDTHLVAIGRLQEVLASIPTGIDSTFPEINAASRKLQLCQGQYDLEDSKSSRWFDYVQIGWDWESDSILSKKNRNASNLRPLTGEIGIVIPLFDGSNQDMARKRAALADAKGDYLDQRRDAERKLAAMRMEVASLARQAAVLDSLSAKVDAGSLFRDYALRSGSDPLLVLQAKATSIESSWQSEKLRFNILDKYLDLLYMSGWLSRNPGSNPLAGR
jgi:hypothetical protein